MFRQHTCEKLFRRVVPHRVQDLRVLFRGARRTSAWRLIRAHLDLRKRQCRNTPALSGSKMFRECFGSQNFRLVISRNSHKGQVLGDKEIAFFRAAQDENVVRMYCPIPQNSKCWEQRLCFCEVDREYSKVLPNSPLEIRVSAQFCRQKDFLKDNWVHCKTDAPLGLRGEQFRY